MLASELGLAPPPPIPSPPVKTEAPTAVLPPPLPDPARRSAAPPETPEESPNFFDERFDFEEPFDLLESSESPVAADETTDETTEPTERRPRRRRRRRRRGRGGEQRDSAAAATETGDRSVDLDTASLGPSDSQSGAERRESIGPPRTRDEAEADESRDQRSRRRRPRHGRQRREAGEAEIAAGDRREARASSAPSRPPEAEPIDDDLLADEGFDLGDVGEGESSDADQPARLGFRGIPAWSEVVGLLIDKNVEAHAKRPSGGPHHGRGDRGNRGPRDNRGHRGNRGGDKPRS